MGDDPVQYSAGLAGKVLCRRSPAGITDRTGPAEVGVVSCELSCVSECALTLPSLPICLVD